jgi:tRNA A37 threonylcarbamoyladenosine biosynthesis protein TsaE
MDLYRLGDHPEDFAPLNLDVVFRECVSLIEWPVRLSNVTVPTDQQLNVDIRHFSSDDTDTEDTPRRLVLSYPDGSSWGSILDQIHHQGLLDDMLMLTSKQ